MPRPRSSRAGRAAESHPGTEAARPRAHSAKLAMQGRAAACRRAGRPANREHRARARNRADNWARLPAHPPAPPTPCPQPPAPAHARCSPRCGSRWGGPGAAADGAPRKSGFDGRGAPGPASEPQGRVSAPGTATGPRSGGGGAGAQGRGDLLPRPAHSPPPWPYVRGRRWPLGDPRMRGRALIGCCVLEGGRIGAGPEGAGRERAVRSRCADEMRGGGSRKGCADRMQARRCAVEGRGRRCTDWVRRPGAWTECEDRGAHGKVRAWGVCLRFRLDGGLGGGGASNKKEFLMPTHAKGTDPVFYIKTGDNTIEPQVI